MSASPYLLSGRAVCATLALLAFTADAADAQRARRPAKTRLRADTADTTRLRADVAYLASDALEGRGTGTAGNDSAAAFLVRRHTRLGLLPVFVDSSAQRCVTVSTGGERTACVQSYRQPFTARSAKRAHEGRGFEFPAQNVGALLRGTDPVLRDEVVIIGAHYDHLGREIDFAADPEAKDQIRNGADDNASGTAGVLELARRFRRVPTKRSLLFVHFGAEEMGLLGATAFLEHTPVAVPRTQAMINFDMIGRLRGDSLIIAGIGTAAEWRPMIDSVNRARPLTLALLPDGSGRSDHSAFNDREIPVLHFFTNVHDDYHRATDDVEKINVAGMARVLDLAEGVVRELANRPTRLAYVKQAAPPPVAGGGGSNVYLGSVPDMATVDGKGMKLSGVRPGSPADVSGLKAGDVIVEFAGTPVTDLYTYTDALRSKQPGDEVVIVVMRGGERLSLKVVLGKRGG
ncbi:MAG: M28 family peptidase [Gemmatimonadaceae bacterium]|jgi:hypothetical protein|nr:M28 family peptidase [Gemmatimonadaceae bacterium]